MHDWSEDSFDWKMLDDGIDMISSFMRFWGRIGVNSKEKFGTARVYVMFWDGTLHGMLYPGYHFSQFPKWLWSFDLNWIGPFFRKTRLQKLFCWYQSKIYSMAYSRAIKKFPKVKVELVVACDIDELIKERPAIMAMYHFRSFVKTLLRRDVEEEEL